MIVLHSVTAVCPRLLTVDVSVFSFNSARCPAMSLAW